MKCKNPAPAARGAGSAREAMSSFGDDSWAVCCSPEYIRRLPGACQTLTLRGASGVSTKCSLQRRLKIIGGAVAARPTQARRHIGSRSLLPPAAWTSAPARQVHRSPAQHPTIARQNENTAQVEHPVTRRLLDWTWSSSCEVVRRIGLRPKRRIDAWARDRALGCMRRIRGNSRAHRRQVLAVFNHAAVDSSLLSGTVVGVTTAVL